jgi:hypothetical protein
MGVEFKEILKPLFKTIIIHTKFDGNIPLKSEHKKQLENIINEMCNDFEYYKKECNYEEHD